MERRGCKGAVYIVGEPHLTRLQFPVPKRLFTGATKQKVDLMARVSTIHNANSLHTSEILGISFCHVLVVGGTCPRKQMPPW